MKTQFRITTITTSLAAALLIGAGSAYAAERAQPAFAEEAPATLSFGTDPNDNTAPQLAATAQFVDTNTRAPVNTRVAAGFREGGDEATGDVASQTQLASGNADGQAVAGTR